MKTELLENIKRKYEQKRFAAQSRADKFKNDIYEKNVELFELDTQIKLAGLNLSKIVLQKPENVEQEIVKIKSYMEDLKTKKERLLSDLKLSKEDFEPKYECQSCDDTGYTTSGERCKCYKQQIIESLYNMSNIKHRLLKENFDVFDINIFSNDTYKNESTTPRQNMHIALDFCMSFCNKFESEVPSLLFYGTTGVGKTFMCNCIAKELIEKGKTIVYQTASNLIEIMEKHRFDRLEESAAQRDSYNFLFDCDLLIIDDLGTELNNSFTNSELFNVINTRLIGDKKMIISTNLSVNELANIYSDRIVSRIFNEFATFKFFGKDLRWENV